MKKQLLKSDLLTRDEKLKTKLVAKISEKNLNKRIISEILSIEKINSKIGMIKENNAAF